MKSFGWVLSAPFLESILCSQTYAKLVQRDSYRSLCSVFDWRGFSALSQPRGWKLFSHFLQPVCRRTLISGILWWSDVRAVLLDRSVKRSALSRNYFLPQIRCRPWDSNAELRAIGQLNGTRERPSCFVTVNEPQKSVKTTCASSLAGNPSVGTILRCSTVIAAY